MVRAMLEFFDLQQRKLSKQAGSFLGKFIFVTMLVVDLRLIDDRVDRNVVLPVERSPMMSSR